MRSHPSCRRSPQGSERAVGPRASRGCRSPARGRGASRPRTPRRGPAWRSLRPHVPGRRRRRREERAARRRRECVAEPRLERIERTASPGPSVRLPRANRQPAFHRVAAAAELRGNPLRPPAKPPQPAHRLHVLRRLHLSPRASRPQGPRPLAPFAPLLSEGSVFMSSRGQFSMSPDRRQPALLHHRRLRLIPLGG